MYFVYDMLKSNFLAGGNCSVSQLFTKSTLGRYARQQRKTITIKKHDIQAEDVVLPPTTNSKLLFNLNLFMSAVNYHCV